MNWRSKKRKLPRKVRINFKADQFIWFFASDREVGGWKRKHREETEKLKKAHLEEIKKLKDEHVQVSVFWYE